MTDEPSPPTAPAEPAPSTPTAPPAKVKKTDQPKLDGTKLRVKLFSPYKDYFDGDAKSVSAENDTGPFDILPRHHNFITLVKECEIVVNPPEGEEKRFRISKAVMHVRHNVITVFLDV